MKKIILVSLLSLLFIPLFASASFNTNLSYGLRQNDDVKQLQEFLISKHFLSGSATGNFLSLTRSAVKAYQVSAGIASTGYVGTLTRIAINTDLAKQSSGMDQGAQPQVATPPVVSESFPPGCNSFFGYSGTTGYSCASAKMQALNLQPSIALVSPNGGETLKQGQVYAITWTAANLPTSSGFSHFTLELQNDQNKQSFLISKYDISWAQTSYYWTVPNLNTIAGEGSTSQTQLKIQLIFADQNQLRDTRTYLSSTSANYFSIVE